MDENSIQLIPLICHSVFVMEKWLDAMRRHFRFSRLQTNFLTIECAISCFDMQIIWFSIVHGYTRYTLLRTNRMVLMRQTKKALKKNERDENIVKFSLHFLQYFYFISMFLDIVTLCRFRHFRIKYLLNNLQV